MAGKDPDNTLKECIESVEKLIITEAEHTLNESFSKREEANNTAETAPQSSQGSSLWTKARYYFLIVTMILIVVIVAIVVTLWLLPIPAVNTISVASGQQGPEEIKELIICEYILRFLLLAVLFIVLLKGYKYNLQHKKQIAKLTIKNEQDQRAFIRFFLQHSSDTKQQEQKKK